MAPISGTPGRRGLHTALKQTSLSASAATAKPLHGGHSLRMLQSGLSLRHDAHCVSSPSSRRHASAQEDLDWGLR
jgi:hypothetical protein